MTRSLLPLAVTVRPEAVSDEPDPVTNSPCEPLPFELIVVPEIVTWAPPVAATPTAPLAGAAVVTEPPVIFAIAPLSTSIPFAVGPPATAAPEVLTVTP